MTRKGPLKAEENATKGDQLAAELRSRCNGLTGETRQDSRLIAMAIIHGPRYQPSSKLLKALRVAEGTAKKMRGNQRKARGQY